MTAIATLGKSCPGPSVTGGICLQLSLSLAAALPLGRAGRTGRRKQGRVGNSAAGTACAPWPAVQGQAAEEEAAAGLGMVPHASAADLVDWAVLD